MKHKAIVLFLAMILQVGASVGAFANNLPYAVDFAPIRFADSLVVASDTVPADSLSSKTAKKEAIDAPVYYESTDSMVWSTNGNAFLYGSGKVVYAKIMQHGCLFNELEIQLQFRVFACHFKSKFRNFPGMYIVNLFQFIIQRVIEIYYLSVIYSSHKTLF